MTDGSISWHACDTIGDGVDYAVRIVSTETETIEDTSDAVFSVVGSAPPRTITVGNPNGGESWVAGTLQTITWTSENASGEVTIILENGGEFYSYLGTAPMADEQFDWQSCDFVGDGSDYRIRVSQCGCGPCVQDVSDLPFEGRRLRYGAGLGFIYNVDLHLSLNGLVKFFVLEKDKDLFLTQDTTFQGGNLAIGLTYRF